MSTAAARAAPPSAHTRVIRGVRGEELRSSLGPGEGRDTAEGEEQHHAATRERGPVAAAARKTP
jgi:hypothetical protein